jgi:hypothetical protein
MEAQLGPAEERKAWWSARRTRYNVLLLMAFPISVLALFAVWVLFEDQLPCFELTGTGLGRGIVLFALALGIANVFYSLGPLGERLLRPQRPGSFRRWVFGAGMVVSLALVFSPVAVTLRNALSALPCTDEQGKTHIPRPAPW